MGTLDVAASHDTYQLTDHCRYLWGSAKVGGGGGFAPVKGAKPEVGGVRELEVAIALYARSFETSSFPIRPNPAPPFFPSFWGALGGRVLDPGCRIKLGTFISA